MGCFDFIGYDETYTSQFIYLNKSELLLVPSPI